MGIIPLYFRHLVNNFDDVLTSNKNLKQCDNLYLDLNCRYPLFL